MNPRTVGVVCAVVAALLGGSGAAHGAAAPPDWLREAATRELPQYGPDIPAVVLMRQRTLTVSGDGRTTCSERGVIRVLTNEGRSYAGCAAVYLTGNEKVTEMRAWLLPESGPARVFGREDCVDAKLASNDVYNETRQRLISAMDEASAGATFGYEWTLSRRSVFMQYIWDIPNDVPTLACRLNLRLPAGWHATGTTFDHEAITPVAGEDGLSWELRDLPAAKSEPAAPPASARMPRLALSFGPERLDDPEFATAFRSWDQVSRWMASLSDPQAELDETLRARAAALVAGTPPGLDRIRAIGTFVQGLNYIEIETDVAEGGGYRPHAARVVLDKGYGDCKDKANLMRAMLAAIDVPSWLVSIHSSDPTRVRREWPSPMQFNHCILAIRPPPGTSLAACLEDDTYGRLCLFDPTNPLTPLGDLPRSEQGGLALIISAKGGHLIRAPVTPPESSTVRRAVEARMQDSGEIDASLHETSTGAMASAARAERRGATEAEYQRHLEEWIGRGVPGAIVERARPADDRVGNRFDLEVAFTAPRWGRWLSDTLYAICPAIARSREASEFTEQDRTLPIVIPGEQEEETVDIALPPSFAAEDFPDTVSIDTPIGSYHNAYAFRNGRLHASRTLVTHAVTLPAERYPEVVAFFQAVRRAETAKVVLRIRP